MIFVLLVFTALSLALTYNVLRPLYRHPKRIVPSFVFGWLAGELALHVIAFQLIIIFFMAWGGVINGFWGGDCISCMRDILDRVGISLLFWL